jgi:2'-5' RNA ligase
MRAFFCVTLDERRQAAIGSVAERLRSETRMRASWVRPGNYHLTVRFLGEIEPALTVEMDELCRDVVRTLDPFGITFDRVGAFPSVEGARVLWIGGETPAEYVDLVDRLNEALRSLGFDRERKRAVAHVTVARIKGRPDPELGRLLEEAGSFPRESTRVEHVTLMESRLTPDGAVYTPLFEAPLGG